MSRVRLATTADVAPLADALAEAFASDPVWRWLVPDDRRWARRAGAVFAYEVEARLAQGHVYTSDDRAGAALWTPPGRRRGGWRGWLAQVPAAPAAAALVGRDGSRRGLALQAEMKRLHPRQDHWYLAMLGTRPADQGRGVGTAALAPVLARADLDGVGAYLESSNPDNEAFYGRHGFETTGHLTAAGSPPLALMWRAPRPVDDEPS